MCMRLVITALSFADGIALALQSTPADGLALKETLSLKEHASNVSLLAQE